MTIHSIHSSLIYDRRTIVLHWLTALLVVGLWSVGQTIDWFPKGNARTFARSAHITTGVMLGFVIVYRLWWRLTAGRQLPPADQGLVRVISTLTHRSLYFFVCTTVVLGIANAWIRGDNLFNLFSIPAFDPSNKDLRDRVEELHGLSADVLLSIAGFHALAGLMHKVLFKDAILRRMIPFIDAD